MAETWQDWVRRRAGELGLVVTSGYRSPAHNADIHGSPSSYHTTGSAALPGAIDVGGAADKLKQFWNEAYNTFAGRIQELFLNVPASGEWLAVKNNSPLARNPEAGRGQHVHISVGPPVLPPGGRGAAHRLVTDVANAGNTLGEAGEAAARRAGIDAGKLGAQAGGKCPRRACLPAVPHLIDADSVCLCWSDVFFYAAAIALVGWGSIALLTGAKA